MKIPLEGQNALTKKQARSMITALNRGIVALNKEIGTSHKSLFEKQRAKEALNKLKNAYILHTDGL